MIESSSKTPLFFKWLHWHFIECSGGILKAWGNFLSFNFNYFSILDLLKSLFSHWKKDKVSYGKGFSPLNWLNAFLSNMISRVLGAFVRIIVIVFGLFFEMVFLFLGLFLFLLWFFLPFLALVFLYFSLV